MHVAILIGSFSGGGAERAMVNFANGLDNKGVKVDLLVGYETGPYRSLVNPGIHITALGGGMMRSVPKIRKWLGINAPQILFCTQPHVGIAAILSTRFRKNRPTVVFREATTPSRDFNFKKSLFGKAFLLLSSWLIRRADHLIATCKDAATDSQRFYRIQPNQITPIYSSFVTDDIFEQADEPIQHPWLSENKTIVSTLGRVMPVKDFKTLVQAFGVVRKEIDCKLLIIGETDRDPEYFEELTQLIESLEIKQEVDFVGFKSNPFPYLKHTDVYVLSSIYEGLPGSLVQAMALGCRLVSTNCPSGPREVLDDGKFGTLVPVADHAAMATAISEALAQPQQQVDGRQGAERFTEEFAINRLHELFQRLLENRPVG